ncbi:MAG: HRDC domain-containing protein, partial [Gemmatimonadaceae bacterium]
VANWRDSVAAELDRATFRVVGNEPLLELARLQPSDRHGLAANTGRPRGMPELRTADLLDAIARGKAVPDAELPRFPRSRRWDKDAEFDARVSALKTARDAVALRLDLDPGVLCAKDRIEAVARRNPETLDELAEVTELRRWQIDALGKEYLQALKPHRGAAAKATDESPYKE